jgi:hypothetical protein
MHVRRRIQNSSDNLLLGLGVSKLTFGGMVRCSNASIALIIEVLPLAASE